MRSFAADGVNALLIVSYLLFAANIYAIVSVASTERLRKIIQFADFVRYRSLVAYGPDLQDLFRWADAVARRIMDRASDLPMECPAHSILVPDRRLVGALGL